MVLDVTHVGSLDPTLASAEVLLGPRLLGIHLSDMAREPSDPLRRALGRFATTHRLPGKGILPLRDLLPRLASAGFAGPVTLEVSPAYLSLWRPWALERTLQDAVAAVRDGWERPRNGAEERAG